MSSLGRLFNIQTRFAGVTYRKDCLDRLPNDVLLDCIMNYLDVVDIIRLRRVSKLYYELTHHAALWKRRLRTAEVPLPPLPPTSRHTPDRMSGVEAERLLCRAYSLDRNWKRPRPRCLREWAFDAHHRVLEMALLPGGRYLVASVSDVTGSRYSLVIYAIDTVGHSRPIAKTDTATKAYAIRAKYVTIRGEKSIAIAYLRRDYHHKSDKRKAAKGLLFNVSEYSTYHEIDPEVEFRHECMVIHARLSSLECLTDLTYHLDPAKFMEAAARLPPPFENLVCVRSRPQHRLMCPDIEEMYDSPYLAVAKFPNDIVFKRLDGGPSATLTCSSVLEYAESEHAIKAIRLLPHEGCVFVVREIDVPRTAEQPCPVYAFEKYSVIPAGPEKVSQLRESDDCVLGNSLGRLSHVHIADPNTPPRDDDSIVGQLRKAGSGTINPPPPPPLGVYGHRVGQEGVVNYHFFVKRNVLEFPPTPPSAGGAPNQQQREVQQRVSYEHSLRNYGSNILDVPDHKRVRIVPAVARPLLLFTSRDDISDAPQIVELAPWSFPGLVGPPRTTHGAIVHLLIPARLAAFAEEPWNGLNVASIAWDETIGRLVLAPADAEDIYVFDFAYAPRQDIDGKRLPFPVEGIPDPGALPPAPADGMQL